MHKSQKVSKLWVTKLANIRMAMHTHVLSPIDIKQKIRLLNCQTSYTFIHCCKVQTDPLETVK